MSRRSFPGGDSSLVYGVTGAGAALTGVAGTFVTVYLDAAGTQVASDLQTPAGAAVTNGRFLVDTTSRVPRFLGPNDGTSKLYVKPDGSSVVSPLYADAEEVLSTAAGTFLPIPSAAVAPWASGVVYAKGQSVTQGGFFWTSATAHTSGATFSGSVATGGNWVQGAPVAGGAGAGLRNFGAGNLLPVGPRNAVPIPNQQSSATSLNSRVRCVATVPVTDVRLVFTNFLTNNPGVDQVGQSALTVRAAIEYPVGTFTPVYFDGGRDVVIQPGAIAVSAATAVDHPGFTGNPVDFQVRTFVTQTGGTIPVNVATAGANEGGVTGGTDLTTSGTIAGTIYAYGPAAVLAATTGAVPRLVAGVGDSITQGTGDGPLDGGWLTRASESQGFPLIKTALSGETGAQFLTTHNRLPLILGATHATVLYGTNDLNNAITLAQVQAILVSIWKRLAARTIKPYAVTIPPRTTSTDAFATTANQTATASNPTRIQINDWLRAGAPLTAAGVATTAGAPGSIVAGQPGHPLVAYSAASPIFDLADVVESARNSGVWKLNSTGDGTHPSNGVNGAPLIASTFAIANLT